MPQRNPHYVSTNIKKLSFARYVECLEFIRAEVFVMNEQISNWFSLVNRGLLPCPNNSLENFYILLLEFYLRRFPKILQETEEMLNHFYERVMLASKTQKSNILMTNKEQSPPYWNKIDSFWANGAPHSFFIINTYLNSPYDEIARNVWHLQRKAETEI